MQQTTLALSLTLPFIATTLGAILIFFFKSSSKTINSIAVGTASGIMLSASFFSLIMPALEDSKSSWGNFAIIPVALGFLLGVILMILLSFLSEKLFKNNDTSKHKAFKLFSAITIHNIPEGLSVGFAVGTAFATNSSHLSALMFAVGIAIQNFPEGLATALPLNNCLNNKKKSFFLAVLSGLVEPLFATAGFFLASSISSLMPWLLSLSAGSMIYVIVEELIPDIRSDKKFPLGSCFFVIGFLIMMILDICL